MGEIRGLGQPKDQADKTNAGAAADALLKEAWTNPPADKSDDRDVSAARQRTEQILAEAKKALEEAKKDFEQKPAAQKLQELQKTVGGLLPLLNATIKTENAGKEKGDLPIDLQKIQQEVNKGQFGPELQRAYQWLNVYCKRTEDKVQNTFLLLDSVGLALPPGFPIEPPGQVGGRKMADELFRALLRAEELRLTLLKPGEFPDSRKLTDGVMNAEKWCADGAQLHMSQLLPASCTEVAALAKEIKRPEWAPPKEPEKQEEWLARTAPLVDVGQNIKDLLKIAGMLRMSTNQKEFPVINNDGKEVPGIGAIGSKDSPVRAKFDSEGRLHEFEIDLPEKLEPTYENRKKLEALQQWLDTYGKQIRETASRVMETAADPDKVLVWADFPVGKKKDGSPHTFNDKEYNLESHRFKVEEKDGKIVVNSNIDYYYSGPLNMEDIGASFLGAKTFKTQTFNKWDLVPVLKDRKMVLVRADELKAWMDEQSNSYYKHKGISIGLNLGMILVGGFEAVGAYQAGRAVGMGVLRSMLTREFGAALLHIGIGASGILSSSFYTTKAWGRALQTAQHAYFMFDMVKGGYQLTRGGLAKAGWIEGKAVAKASEVGEAMKNIFETTKWLRWGKTGSQVILKISEVGLAGQLGSGIFGKIKNRFWPKEGLKDISDTAVDVRERAKQDAYFSEFLKGGAKLMGLTDAASKEKLAELVKKTGNADGKPEEKIQEFAKAFQSDNQDVKLAAAVGLLYLRSKDVKELSGKLAGDITKKEAVEFIEKQMTSESHARRMIAGQALLGMEKISGPEYALLCKSLLADEKAPKEVKMRAIVGIGASMTQAELAEAEAKGGDRLNYLASSYGVTRAGLEQILLDAARNDKDVDLRAMAATTLEAFNRDNKAYGWDLVLSGIDRWQALFDKEPPEKSGSYAAYCSERLIQDLSWDPTNQKPQAQQKGKFDEVTETEQRLQSKIMAANLLTMIKPDGYKLEDSIKGLKSCITDGAEMYPDIAFQAVKRLSEIAPRELAAIQPALIGILQADMATDDAGPKARRLLDTKVQLLQSLPGFLANMPADKAAELVAAAESLIKKSNGNDHYAGQFPELRQAAVVALADIYTRKDSGIKANFELLKDRLNNDPSPLVRSAALDALVRLKPADLQEICLDLLKTENDANVLRRLRDVEFSVRRLDIDSEKYLREFQNAIREIVISSSKNLNSGSQFLRSRTELRMLLTDLDQEVWRRRRNAGIPKGGDFKKQANEIREQVKREVENAFVALKNLASNGKDAQRAREALVYLVVSNGKDMGATQDRKAAVERAAATIEELCKDPARKSDFSWGPEMCLLLQPSLSYKARESALRALVALEPKDDHPGKLTRERAAVIIAGALQRELSNTPKDSNDPDYENSKCLQLSLIKELENLKIKDQKVTPVLEAILRQNHPMKEVRDQAEKLLASNRQSSSDIFGRAQSDKASSPMQKAEMVASALKSADAETVCLTISRACKEQTFTNPNDPLRKVILIAAGDGHELVQLTAARMLFNSTVAGDREKAADIVARIEKFGSTQWLRDDAKQIHQDQRAENKAFVDARFAALKTRPQTEASFVAPARADRDWSVDYQDSVQKLQRELKEARRRELSKFDSNEWWERKNEGARKKDYGLLIESKLINAKDDHWKSFLKQYFDEDSWNVLGTITGAFKAQAEFGHNVEAKYQEATKAIDTQMEGQFLELIDTAKNDKGVAGQEARQALAFILLSNGQPFAALQRAGNGKAETYRDWAVRTAADAICDICKGVKPGAADLAWVLKTSLIEQPLLNPEVKTKLLDAFVSMVGDKKLISEKDGSIVIATAIDAQGGDWASQQLLITMLDKLKQWRNPQVVPALEAMTVSHPMFQVRDKAREVFAAYTGAAASQRSGEGAIFRGDNGEVLRVSYKNGTFTQFDYDADKNLIKISDTRNNLTWTRKKNTAGQYTDEWTCDRLKAGSGKIQVDDSNGTYTFTSHDAQGNKRILRVESATMLETVENIDGSKAEFLGPGKIVLTYADGKAFSVTYSAGQPVEYTDTFNRTWKSTGKTEPPGNPVWETTDPQGKAKNRVGSLSVSSEGLVTFTTKADQSHTVAETVHTDCSVVTRDTRKPDEITRKMPDGSLAIFDRFGQLSSFKNAQGLGRTYTYEFGKLIGVREYDREGKHTGTVNLRDLQGTDADPVSGAYFYRDSQGLKHGVGIGGAEIKFDKSNRPVEIAHSKTDLSTLTYSGTGVEPSKVELSDKTIWTKKEHEGKLVWHSKAPGAEDCVPRTEAQIKVLPNAEILIIEGSQTTIFRHNGRSEQTSPGNPTVIRMNGLVTDASRTVGGQIHVEYSEKKGTDNKPLMLSVLITDKDGKKVVWTRDKESVADTSLIPTWTAEGQAAMKGECKIDDSGTVTLVAGDRKLSYQAYGTDTVEDKDTTVYYHDGIKQRISYKSGPIREESFDQSGKLVTRLIEITGAQAESWLKDGKLSGLGQWDGFSRCKIDGVNCIVSVSGTWNKTDSDKVKYKFDGAERCLRVETPNGTVRELDTKTNSWTITTVGKPLVEKVGNNVTIWRANGEQILLKLDDSGKVKSFCAFPLDLRTRAQSYGSRMDQIVIPAERQDNGRWVGKNSGGGLIGYPWKSIDLKADNSVVLADNYGNETVYSTDGRIVRTVKIANGTATLETLDDRIVSIKNATGTKKITYEGNDQSQLELPDGRKLVREKVEGKFTNNWKCGDKIYKDLNVYANGMIEWNSADDCHFVCNVDGKVLKYKVGEKVQPLTDIP